jgi:hypothetical protein
MPIQADRIIKISSVVVSGAGTVLGGASEITHIIPLKVAGAIASVAGSLLDDVPEFYLTHRAQEKLAIHAQIWGLGSNRPQNRVK